MIDSVGSGTRSSHEVGQRAYLCYCASHDLTCPLPPTHGMLMGFACYEADYLSKPYGAIKSYLPGVRHLCKLTGVSTAAFKSEQLELVMRSIRRGCPSTRRPKRLAITVPLMSDMLLLLDPERYEHAVLRPLQPRCTVSCAPGR